MIYITLGDDLEKIDFCSKMTILGCLGTILEGAKRSNCDEVVLMVVIKGSIRRIVDDNSAREGRAGTVYNLNGLHCMYTQTPPVP